jgi:uncharacterized protein YbaP (TraB family)
MYHWVDANGTVHYTQNPPQHRTFSTRETADTSAASVSNPSPDTSEAGLDHVEQGEVAAASSSPARTAAVSFDSGLLWKISHPSTQDIAPSHLFGTIHSEDPRVLQLPDKVRNAFDASQHFCMEVVFDARTSLILAQSMVYRDGQELRSILGGMLFNKVAALMAGHGIPKPALIQMKPWAVFTTLSSPKKETGVFLDVALAEQAKQQGKPVCGLETAEEQVAVFEAAATEDQVVLLRETVRQYPQLPKHFVTLLDLYLARDLAGLVALSEEQIPKDPEVKRVYQILLKRLLDQRNTRMQDRMMAKLEDGGAFIAVGALHLPGENGLLHMLHRRGYTLEAVY